MPEPVPFDTWVAHDAPERPLDHGVWVCDCEGCALALDVAARLQPRFTFMIRINGDRIAVTADYLAEVRRRDGCIEALLYREGDWIRDVGWATRELDPPYRWWSLTLEEEEGRAVALRISAPDADRPAVCPEAWSA